MLTNKDTVRDYRMLSVSEETATERHLYFGKSVYLLVLLLISVDFFHFTPISAFTTDDICLVLFFIWLIAGIFLYKPKQQLFSITLNRWYWPLPAVWLGVLISFLAAKALFDQALFVSLVASRRMFSMLALPVLGIVNPRMKDVEKAVVWFSLVLLVFSVLDAVGVPILDRDFFINDSKPWKKLIEDDSFVMLLPGFQWVAVAFYFYLHRLKVSVNAGNIVGCLFFIAALFLMQNRTTLFVSSAIFAYTLLTLKGQRPLHTVFFRAASVLLIVGAVALTLPQWISLVTETSSQLGNDDYNRILAYNYFLFNACPKFIYYLTGVGFISATTSPIIGDLMDSGIYNSDVGFVGFWNYYGIIPVIAFFIVVIDGLRRRTPLFVKYNAILILVGSLTIACFNTIDKILWLCVFIYMVYGAAWNTEPSLEIDDNA